MSERQNLIAFLALIGAITVLAFYDKGTDAVVVGLVGIAGTFRPRNSTGEVTVNNDKNNPIPVEGAKDA